MEQNQFAGAVQKLRAWGLPMLVSPSSETIASNDHVISTRLGRLPSQPQRRLVCAFDRTYIEQSMQLFRGESGPGFSGGGVLNYLHGK